MILKKFYSWAEGLIEPFPDSEPQTPPNTLFAFIWHYTKPFWPFLALIAALAASIAIGEVLIFSFLGSVVDWLAGAERETFFQAEGMKLIGMALLILFIMPALGFILNVVIHQSVVGNYPMAIRWLGHRYLLGQSMDFYQDEFAGRIATKVMQASLGIREVVLKCVDILVYVSVYFLGVLILVASFDFWLVLPFLFWVVGYTFVLRHFLPKMRDISKQQADARSVMTGRIVDSYTNIATVKLFAHSKRELEYARHSMDGFLQTVHPQMRLVTNLHVCLYLMNNTLLFSVGAVGIWLWFGSATAPGAVAIAIALVLRLQGMSQWIMWELAGLFENLGMVIDGMNTLSKPRTIIDKPKAETLKVTDGNIEYDNITFNYGQDKGVIENLSLNIKPGEKIGLVGRSGAGKSTLVNLLLRFYDLEAGQLRIDGQNIADVAQESLRYHVGMVTQDTSLLHRSVRDNILYSRPDASEEMMIESAKRAKAYEFIQDLSDPKGRTGFDAHVGERGVKLSGGQRQRIAIARVMLKNAPILILDEATSALDSEVEVAIQDSFHHLMEGKTVIAIAHRLSTIAAMDRLVIMDEGKIVEMGTHDELIQSGGIYSYLWEHQSGGFLPDNAG